MLYLSVPLSYDIHTGHWLPALYDMHVYARIRAVQILNAWKLQANDSHELSCEIGCDVLFHLLFSMEE